MGIVTGWRAVGGGGGGVGMLGDEISSMGESGEDVLKPRLGNFDRRRCNNGSWKLILSSGGGPYLGVTCRGAF